MSHTTRIVTVTVVALTLATGLASIAAAGGKKKASGQDLYKEYCKPCHMEGSANGEVLEQHYVNSPDRPGEMGLSTSSPFVSAGKVLVGSETGGLRCFVGEEVH